MPSFCCCNDYDSCFFSISFTVTFALSIRACTATPNKALEPTSLRLFLSYSYRVLNRATFLSWSVCLPLSKKALVKRPIYPNPHVLVVSSAADDPRTNQRFAREGYIYILSESRYLPAVARSSRGAILDTPIKKRSCCYITNHL